MKHFISEDKTKLIQFNHETGVYKQRNHDAKETNNIVRWARAKNCAPIFNEITKKIM